MDSKEHTMRTQQGKPVQSKNGMWSSTFENWMGPVGKEYLGSSVESGAVWPDEDTALEAGQRALQQLEQTGKYPNMCQRW